MCQFEPLESPEATGGGGTPMADLHLLRDTSRPSRGIPGQQYRGAVPEICERHLPWLHHGNCRGGAVETPRGGRELQILAVRGVESLIEGRLEPATLVCVILVVVQALGDAGMEMMAHEGGGTRPRLSR